MFTNATVDSRILRIYAKRYFKFDFVAAIVVFLVAIPLCLGIALASGAPLFSGILSGIVGGVVVGWLSSSHVSVSGPAAGMVAVVVAAIAHIGDFNSFLIAVILAGLLQIIIGSLRAGFVADYVPSNVVQGLLCAIGILLIIKQLPLAFTLSADFNELKTHLLETTEEITLSPILALYHHINTGAMLITILSISTLIYFDVTKNKVLKEIPAPILVVILGVLLNELFQWTDSNLAQNSPQLVNIPQTNGFYDLFSQLEYPNWAALTNPQVYVYAFIICIVASLETLLNLKAGEKLDKKRRHASSNRELVAQGVGNMTAGLIGGIPITSVIVRTSINIQAGSKSKISAILHGIFIFLAVLLIPGTLNKIPLSSLAAILIYTGYKLNKPSIYRSIYAQGSDRFIPFIATVISIIVFNLLTGILIGLAVSLFYILKSNSQARINILKEFHPTGEINRLVLPQQMTFLNKAALVAELDSIPRESQLIIDARYTQYIDKEISELLKEFKEEQAPNKKIALNMIGFKEHYKIHNYIDFINVTTYDVQSNLSPAQVLNILYEGNQRFLNDNLIHRSNQLDIKYTAKEQHPIAIVLGCIDSRVPVETIFDVSFGDIFCVRVAGNVVNNDVLASIEYACNVVGVKLIIILGHTRCGAIQSACDGVEKGHITELLDKIKPAINAERETEESRNSKNTTFLNNVTELNVANTMQKIYERSSILHEMIEQNDISMVGAVYNVQTGKVHFKNYEYELSQLGGKNYEHLASKLNELLEETKMKV
ncbi:TPA: SulP family inorganic anion transporter [Legionella anisa]|uniref:Carbonic anhydrase n=1 Tax=Legionella anisa TaxID=28082 RepID=A0AAX0WZS0_9GAMM|nr:SulP family inorganic anion transporter [Legionella anisa]AWN73671.1 carbonic anhydrase [Legionella anisa]MBN5936321.1 bifunctional SulP family inorganic anion transporter/carbonic anhydrase [Legionella anisa]MCW8426564.1 SulP family inorganic anion transporter [Legionella anisa]MCW8448227.1 SulP family inorganic anion transporter [Legionella anisa]PNL62419.1 carbonic anhydrase [Legionella anisa]